MQTVIVPGIHLGTINHKVQKILKVASSSLPPAGQQIFVISRTINDAARYVIPQPAACRLASCLAGWPTRWLTAMRSKIQPFITGFVLVLLPAVIKHKRKKRREEEKK